MIWCPGPCTTCNLCTSRTPATALRSTRRPTPRCTGSPRPCIRCATSCTAHKWNGRTPTLSPLKSPYKPRGESTQHWQWCCFYTASSFVQLVWKLYWKSGKHQETVAASMCISETVHIFTLCNLVLVRITGGTLQVNDKDAALVFIPLWHLQISFSSCSFHS